MPTRGYSRGGTPSVPTSQTEAADTSGAPVAVTLPALAGLAEGYLVRVYDSATNAATNNVTINAHADDGGATVATISTDDGEAWCVVVAGVWEQRGSWPEPAPVVPETLQDIVTAMSWDHAWLYEPGASYLADTGSGGVEGLLPLTKDGSATEMVSVGATLPGTLGALWVPAASTGARVRTGPTAAKVDRVTDCWGMIVVGSAGLGSSTNQALVQWGGASGGGDNAFGTIRAGDNSTDVKFYDPYGTTKLTFTGLRASEMASPVVIFVQWDAAATLYRGYWMDSSRVEQSVVSSTTSAGLATAYRQITGGGDGAWQFTAPMLLSSIIFDRSTFPDPATRARVYAAVGRA